MTTLNVELPDQLREQLRAFVAQGWYSSESELVQEALRRFLEARAPELAARFVKEDVDWGLEGMTRPVVCDAGPLIHLDQLGSLDLLSDFVSVQVPEVVWAEVLKHRPKALPQPFLPRPAAPVAADLETLALCRAFSLDAGEADCLALLATKKDFLFLTDDSAARLVAEQMKIEVHGTLGILIRGARKRKRSPAQVIEILESLPSRSTLYISPRLLADVVQKLKKEWGIPG